MKAIGLKVGRKAEIVNFDGLDDMQRYVGGWIEAVYPYGDPVAIVLNEEGKIQGLEFNRGIQDEIGDYYDWIAGNAFIIGVDENDFCDISEDMLEKYMNLYEWPQTYVDGYIWDYLNEE